MDDHAGQPEKREAVIQREQKADGAEDDESGRPGGWNLAGRRPARLISYRSHSSHNASGSAVNSRPCTGSSGGCGSTSRPASSSGTARLRVAVGYAPPTIRGFRTAPRSASSCRAWSAVSPWPGPRPSGRRPSTRRRSCTPRRPQSRRAPAAVPCPLVARVEVVAARQGDRRRTEKFVVKPVDGAGRVTEHAVDALAELPELVDLGIRLTVLAGA